MQIFNTTLGQMIYLFSFIAIGYILVKVKILDGGAATVLSKLENNLFLPALIIGTFLNSFTPEDLGVTWKLILFSFIIMMVTIPIALLIGRACDKDKYNQSIIAYGLSFSNFSFMGNAIVQAVFPDIFMEYVIFTLVIWVFIYAWATPTLLIRNENTRGFLGNLKSFCNPMFISIFIGLALSIMPFELPYPVMSLINTSGSCMAPIAMLLTGITVGASDIKSSIFSKPTLISCAFRLLIIPVTALFIFYFIPIPDSYIICAFSALAMPLGLSPIVIPAAYGKDTTMAAAMALLSHVLSVITLPFMFMLMTWALNMR